LANFDFDLYFSFIALASLLVISGSTKLFAFFLALAKPFVYNV